MAPNPLPNECQPHSMGGAHGTWEVHGYKDIALSVNIHILTVTCAALIRVTYSCGDMRPYLGAFLGFSQLWR